MRTSALPEAMAFGQSSNMETFYKTVKEKDVFDVLVEEIKKL
jgi:hypothetical protein